MLQQRPIGKHVNMLLLMVLGLILNTTDALRKDLYEVGSADDNRSSLRGKPTFSRNRASSSSRNQPQHSNRERNLSFGAPEETNILPDPELIGIVEDRRFHAMELMFEAEKMMFALRMSMSLSMSMDMSMPSVPVR